jgi:hypothetical protein
MEHASHDMTQIYLLYIVIKLYLNHYIYWAVLDLRGDRARIELDKNAAGSGTPVVLRFINFITLGSLLSQRPHLFCVIFSAIIGYVAPRLLVCCRLPV